MSSVYFAYVVVHMVALLGTAPKDFLGRTYLDWLWQCFNLDDK
jgi:hypothetical protein